MISFVDGILTSLVYLLASFILFYIGKISYQLFHRDIKVVEALAKDDNQAFSVAYAGYYIGLLLAIGSALMGESSGLLLDLMDIGVYGMLSILLLNLSVIVNDKIILNKFSLKKEIIDERNVSTGFAEGAVNVSTGLIILGAIHGEGYGTGGPIVTAMLYWLLGMVILFITSRVYNFITPYDIHEHISKRNIAVGIGFSGALIAIANLIRFGLMHDFENWLVTLENVAFDAGLGLAFLPLARFMTDKIILPGYQLTHELVHQEKPNTGVAVIEAFAYIGGSVLITWALSS